MTELIGNPSATCAGASHHKMHLHERCAVLRAGHDTIRLAVLSLAGKPRPNSKLD